MTRTAMIALAVLLAAAEPAVSCTCVVGAGLFEDHVADAFADATFVFLGQIESVESATDFVTGADGRTSSLDVQVARIEVLKSWKGSKKAGDLVVTRTTTTCCLCGLDVKADQQLLVYAYGAEPLALSYCSRTSDAGANSEDIPVIERILRGEPLRPMPIEVPEPQLRSLITTRLQPSQDCTSLELARSSSPQAYAAYASCVIDNSYSAFNGLYTRHLRYFPNEQQDVEARFTIGTDGTVERAEAESAEMSDAEFLKRVAARIKIIKFLPFEGGTQQVRHTFEFSQTNR